MACGDLPQVRRENHWIARTCAHTASIPMNNASDVSAAASSTTARTMTRSPLLDRTRTMFYFCSGVKAGAVRLQPIQGWVKLLVFDDLVLTYMSICIILAELISRKKLSTLPSLFTGMDTARTLLVSPEVLAAVSPPFADNETGHRLGEFRAWLDSFSEGGEISVAEDPNQKPPDAMLARVAPVEDELWSIRVTEPADTSGIRALGAFATKDKFICLIWDYREGIAVFDDEVERAREVWRDLFGTQLPLKGGNLDEYLTNYRVV